MSYFSDISDRAYALVCSALQTSAEFKAKYLKADLVGRRYCVIQSFASRLGYSVPTHCAKYALTDYFDKLWESERSPCSTPKKARESCRALIVDKSKVQERIAYWNRRDTERCERAAGLTQEKLQSAKIKLEAKEQYDPWEDAEWPDESPNAQLAAFATEVEIKFHATNENTGAIQVGTSVPMDLEYKADPSKWMREGAIIHRKVFDNFRCAGWSSILNESATTNTNKCQTQEEERRAAFEEMKEYRGQAQANFGLDTEAVKAARQRAKASKLGAMYGEGKEHFMHIGVDFANPNEKDLTGTRAYRIVHDEITEIDPLVFNRRLDMSESKNREFFATITKRYVSGVDITTLSNDAISYQIENEENAIERLKNIKHKTKATVREIEAREANVRELIAYLDSIDTEANKTPAAPVVLSDEE